MTSRPTDSIRSPAELTSPHGRQLLARTGILGVCTGALLFILAHFDAPLALGLATIAAFAVTLAGHACPVLAQRLRLQFSAIVIAGMFALCVLAVLAPHSLDTLLPRHERDVVAVPFVIGSPEATLRPPPPAPHPTSVEITITSPTEGSKVNHLERIDGTVSDPSLTVLVVVTTFEDSAFWVQHKAQVRERDDGSGRAVGRWYSLVYFGRSATEDHGKRFAVMAIATPDPEQFPLGEREVPVPPDVARSEPVTVVRK